MQMCQLLLQRSRSSLFWLAIVTKPFKVGALHTAAPVPHQLLNAPLFLLLLLLRVVWQLQCCLGNVQEHRPGGIGYAGTAGSGTRKAISRPLSQGSWLLTTNRYALFETLHVDRQILLTVLCGGCDQMQHQAGQPPHAAQHSL
jgi:hypothetical protein